MQGKSIIGQKGEAGRSFFAELEEMYETEGSGEDVDDIFTQIPALELMRGLKGLSSIGTSVCNFHLRQ